MISGILISFLVLAMATALAGNASNRVSVTLVPEVAGLAAIDSKTGTLWLGVDMNIKEGWHVYWRNPGDSGLPTTIRWDEHEFLTPGEIHWPRPARFDEDGITTYGYSDRVVLLVPVSVSIDESEAFMRAAESNTAEKDQKHTLSAHMNWLVCKDICLSESTHLSLETDRGGNFSGYSKTAAGMIGQSRNLVPENVSDWQAKAQLASGRFKITLVPVSQKALLPDSDDIYFYPHEQGVIEHTAPQIVTANSDHLTLEVEVSRYIRSAPDEITGVLSSGESGNSWVRDRDIPAIKITFPVTSGADPE